MAFARFGDDSDVYLFPASKRCGDEVRDVYQCCACILGERPADAGPGTGWSFFCQSVDEFKAHVREHLRRGHKVPPGTFEDIDYWHEVEQHL